MNESASSLIRTDLPVSLLFRRKSCCCTLCGGISKLQSDIQKNPMICMVANKEAKKRHILKKEEDHSKIHRKLERKVTLESRKGSSSNKKTALQRLDSFRGIVEKVKKSLGRNSDFKLDLKEKDKTIDHSNNLECTIDLKPIDFPNNHQESHNSPRQNFHVVTEEDSPKFKEAQTSFPFGKNGDMLKLRLLKTEVESDTKAQQSRRERPKLKNIRKIRIKSPDAYLKDKVTSPKSVLCKMNSLRIGSPEVKSSLLAPSGKELMSSGLNETSHKISLKRLYLQNRESEDNFYLSDRIRGFESHRSQMMNPEVKRSIKHRETALAFTDRSIRPRMATELKENARKNFTVIMRGQDERGYLGNMPRTNSKMSLTTDKETEKKEGKGHQMLNNLINTTFKNSNNTNNIWRIYVQKESFRLNRSKERSLEGTQIKTEKCSLSVEKETSEQRLMTKIYSFRTSRKFGYH